MRSTISLRGTTISGVQRRSSSSGMNSMKRTMTSSSRAKRAKPSISSSLNPRSRTQLILSGREAGGLGGANSGEHFLEAAGNAGDALEGGGVDGVHADGDAIESGGLERSGHFVEEVAVGGERRCRAARRMMVRRRGELLDQFDEAVAEQGFAAGEADFLDAEA